MPAPVAEILGTSSGLLHIPTRRLIEHTPNLYSTWAVPYPYDADAPEPAEWLQFLDTLWPDDEDSKLCLQQWAGYLLSGATHLQKMLMIIGPKRAGKGTICGVLTAMLGANNVVGPTLASLSGSFGLQPFINKPVAIFADVWLQSDSSIIVERLLSISGGDLFTVDRKYRESWTGHLPTRLVLVSNETPKLTDASGALASRFVILALTESWFGKEDHGLLERLLTELPSILKWSLDGLASLHQQGWFTQPKSGDELRDDLEANSQPINTFIREVCETDAGFSVPRNDLFTEYRRWCTTQGIDHPPTLAAFGKDLRAAFPGLKSTRIGGDGNRLRLYEGIRVSAEKIKVLYGDDDHGRSF